MPNDPANIFNSGNADWEKQSVLIVLVNYKRPVDTVACIESLLNQTYYSWKCIVYENGSGDDSFSIINTLLRNSLKFKFHEDSVFDGMDVKILSNNSDHRTGTVAVVNGHNNLGFAGGNNAAIHFAKNYGMYGEDFVWFLNNDTVAEPDALFHLVDRMRMPNAEKIGLCGATLFYFGSECLVQCYGGARYTKWIGGVSELGNGEKMSILPNPDDIEPHLSYVSGASMFARNSFIDAVGLMCEDYFLYFEEIDWAVRGNRLGFELGYAPLAKVWHREGAVLGSGRATGRSPLAEYYGLSSRLLFTRKHYPNAIVTIWLIGCLQLMRRLFNRQWLNAKALFNALSFSRSSRN